MLVFLAVTHPSRQDAGMAISFSQLETDLDAARTAIGNQNWASARRSHTQAMIVLAGLAGEIGDDTSRLRYQSVRDAADAISALIDKAQAESTRGSQSRFAVARTAHQGL